MTDLLFFDVLSTPSSLDPKGFATQVSALEDEQAHRLGSKLVEIARAFGDPNVLYSDCISNNPNVIDADMLQVGQVVGSMLHLQFGLYEAIIDLRAALHKALFLREHSLFALLLDYDIDLFRIESKLITLCAQHDCNDLLTRIVTAHPHLYPIQLECLDNLAALGKLDMLQRLMTICKIPRFVPLHQVTHRICAVAIEHNQLAVLEHFLPLSAFPCMPNIVFEYLICAIKHRAHIDIIKYFTENGVSIRQSNYMAVLCARELGRSDLLEYFKTTDPTVTAILQD
ncbi:Hypothetical protein MVR_LOCUS258 [uncultured virus]|nr:Hypothetical protein MVR_LOCUS258 [uncultured virus]